MQRLLLTAAACSLLAVSFNASAAEMRPGLWEITTEVSMPNMPQMPKGAGGMPATKQTTCMKPTDVKEPQKAFQKDSKCRLKDNKVQGNKVSWQMECEGGMAGSGEMTYEADSYQGMMKMKGPGMDFATKYSGKRVGDCK
jgi:hypothetical protein